MMGRESNYMRQKRAFTLVELLVVIAIIAVLLAVLLPSLGAVQGMAKRMQCQTRLKGIGASVGLYMNDNEGMLPSPEYSGSAKTPFIQHYYTYRVETPGGSGIYRWINMGCLYAGKYIEDARLFYCPATEGWLDEYKQYSNPGPWGTLPQDFNTKNTKLQWINATKGYLWWPQGKDIVKSDVAAEIHANALGNYQVGYPKWPSKQTYLNQNKAISADYSFHLVKGSGWNMNAAFPDGHVAFQKGPQDADGKNLYVNAGQLSDDVKSDPAKLGEWKQVTIAEFMFALQP
jgi:prepilin-type N-terminal cleavage/methylation domain-containing protein/prepilin-type processing-associated H-X9-DG protein